MIADQFRTQLLAYMDDFQQSLATADDDWVVKGFIDVYRNIYTISIDTKVISKIIEIMLFPIIARFATAHNYRMILSEHQNHYPDITFITADETRFALDFKSTYRTSESRVSGFTLGAFTGYFRQRDTAKNITFPYSDYDAHFVLGIVYTRSETHIDERQVYPLDNLSAIPSVVRDFQFLLQEKWRIASDRPGSGNTKNIGSIKIIDDLVAGNGPFTAYDVNVFDDYWVNYLTSDMAQAIDSTPPYRNLTEYWRWRNR